MVAIPKYYFAKSVIIPRKPLSQKARRAGWQGCLIDIQAIAKSGKIPIIHNHQFQSVHDIHQKWQESIAIFHHANHKQQLWLTEILMIIQQINHYQFSLQDIYQHEEKLAKLFPNNQHIKAKIRQQLQFLIDQGYIQFLGNGIYQKSPSPQSTIS